MCWVMSVCFILTFVAQDGLAVAGNAPKIFRRTSKHGLPYVCIMFCAAFTLLSYMGVQTGSGKVFGWFANMTSVAGLMTWFGITITYIRFYKGMKVQGYDRSKLPYASGLQPYAAWYAMVMCFLVCLVSITHYSHTISCLTLSCKYSSAAGRFSSKDNGSLQHS
jgi:amino acid permease